MECSRVGEVELDEKDIPGAALSEPFECHAVPALRWWLLCRGIKAPTAWKKPQLISRFGVLAKKQYDHLAGILPLGLLKRRLRERK